MIYLATPYSLNILQFTIYFYYKCLKYFEPFSNLDGIFYNGRHFKYYFKLAHMDLFVKENIFWIPLNTFV